MRNKLFKIWRFSLPFFFTFFLIHLMKDITQDILKIKTPLDIFGDAKEDLSFLPSTLQNVYIHGLGGLSFIAEAFVLYAIPTVLRGRSDKPSRLERWLIASIIFLTTFFAIAVLLDPSY